MLFPQIMNSFEPRLDVVSVLVEYAKYGNLKEFLTIRWEKKPGAPNPNPPPPGPFCSGGGGVIS